MRRGWIWAAQLAVAGLVVVLVARTIARNWAEFRSLQLSLDVGAGWIALSVATIAVTYAIQVESWRRVLAGWSQRLGYGPAARAWCLANLGRYVPGKVWSVAGMVVLAQRAGVAGWAAAASTVVIQALGLGAGVAVVVASTPGAASPIRLGAALAAALGTIALLGWEGFTRRVARLVPAAAELRPLPLRAVVAGGSLTLLSWLTYGLAFWLLARGLLGPTPLPLPTAAGVFALGYILGWLALFAPGGVGVREVVFIGLLAPYLGSGGAVALSVGSRVLLTLTETGAALATVVVTRATKETAVGPSQS